MTIFEKDADYEAFERVLGEAAERTGMRLLAYCLMPNHWHLVLWPREEGELAGIRRSIQRGSPFGDAIWSEQLARQPGLESMLCPHGRPQRSRTAAVS